MRCFAAPLTYLSNESSKKLPSMLARTESLARPTQPGPFSEICAELGMSIPLAWTSGDVSPVAAIEVYPAATLVAHRIRSTRYKKREQIEERREIIAALRAKLKIGESVADLATSADLVDVAACILAGGNFIAGNAMKPENHSLAEREGGSGRPRRYPRVRLHCLAPQQLPVLGKLTDRKAPRLPG
jgi:hypothetical protein